MKLWIDDVRPAPEGYVWCKSTNEALRAIVVEHSHEIELIDLDHDAGVFAEDGGDFINVLNELERLSHRKKILLTELSFVTIGILDAKKLSLDYIVQTLSALRI